MLLLDDSIKFDDIVEKILIPAYNTQKIPIHEALSSILGQLACIVSRDGSIIR